MKAADGIVMFGEWLPDLPELGNPGVIEARDYIPVRGAYEPVRSTQNYTSAYGSSRPLGGFVAVTSGGDRHVYVSTATTYQTNEGGSTFIDRTGAALTSITEYTRFAQYETLVIATNTNNDPRRQTVGSGANFVALASTGDAPRARQIGVIGAFVLLGDTNSGAGGTGINHLQWCAIDDPTNWPTPGTAAAVTVQAGEQFLPSQFGAITAIVGGDQFGLIFQQTGVTRVTYVGPPVVFQFDTISREIGAFFPNSAVQVEGITYFLSREGVFATDGVSVMPIGNNKCSNYFANDVDLSFFRRIYGGFESKDRVVYWIYPNASATSGAPNRSIMYSIDEKRFARSEFLSSLGREVLFTGPAGTNFGTQSTLNVFALVAGSYAASTFTGSPLGDHLIITAERELHPGLKTHVQGVKPLITGIVPTGSNVTIAVGAREANASSATFTSEVQPNARTGFAAFRSTARFHKARVTVVVASQHRAVGVEYQAVPDGAA